MSERKNRIVVKCGQLFKIMNQLPNDFSTKFFCFFFNYTFLEMKFADVYPLPVV